MSQVRSTYAVPVVPVVIVIGVSTVVVVAIAACLVYQIARKAIDKTNPEGVAPVVLALSSLPVALRLLLPWVSSSEATQRPVYTSDSAATSLHNGVGLEPPTGEQP